MFWTPSAYQSESNWYAGEVPTQCQKNFFIMFWTPSAYQSQSNWYAGEVWSQWKFFNKSKIIPR